MPETFTAPNGRPVEAGRFRHKSGFNAADVPAPRGRPPDGTRVDGREIKRSEYEDLLAKRHALRPAGDLRAQAALSLLRDGRIDETVRRAAAERAERAAYTEARVAYNGARRLGDPAQTTRARQDRDRAGVTEPSEIAIARAAAALLPARAPRGPALNDKRALAALAVESEVQRLRRHDKRERKEIEETFRQVHEIALIPATQLLARGALPTMESPLVTMMAAMRRLARPAQK